MKIRVRFAPSPTGHLHVGNIRTALFNWLYARKHNGSFILRIEDTDAERSESRFERQLIEDLHWLGLDWDEGIEAGGDYGPYRQTERFDLYREQAERLLESGRAYYCFCTAEELERHRRTRKAEGRPILYSGKCRALPPDEARIRYKAGEPATVRLKVRPGTIRFTDLVFGPIEVDAATIGDFILLRSDGSAQYNLAVVIDDALMQVSHVIRGEGHLSNTHRQLLLYESLELPPPKFAHLSTILGPDGSKLSKRHGAASIGEFRDRGYLPEALVNYLSLLGWTPAEGSPEILSVSELISAFELETVHVSPAVFDIEKLNWVNRNHLKKLSREELITRARPFLRKSGILPLHPSKEMLDWAGEVVSALLKYIDKLDDLEKEVRILVDFIPESDLRAPDVLEILSSKEARRVIRVFEENVRALPEGLFDFESYRDTVLKTRDQTGQKGKNLFRPIRIAITARSSGPDLEHLVPLIDRGSLLDLPRPVAGIRRRVQEVRRSMDRIDFSDK